MKVRIWLGIGAVLAVAGVTVTWNARTQAADGVTLVISADGAAKTIDDDIKELQKALDLSKVEKRDLRRVRVLAILIAQNSAGLSAAGKGDKAKLAGQHATAIAVLDALAKEEGAASLKKIAAGFASAKGDSIKPVDYHKYLFDGMDPDVDTAMQLYKSTRAGGLGIEKLIKDFSEKAPTAKDMPTIQTAAYRAASITGYLEQLAPRQDSGKKTKAAWVKFVQDARASAVETAAAAEKKNLKGVKEGLAKMDVSCVGCHEVFKK